MIDKINNSYDLLNKSQTYLILRDGKLKNTEHFNRLLWISDRYFDNPVIFFDDLKYAEYNTFKIIPFKKRSNVW